MNFYLQIKPEKLRHITGVKERTYSLAKAITNNSHYCLIVPGNSASITDSLEISFQSQLII